jgi:hypothetical protein
MKDLNAKSVTELEKLNSSDAADNAAADSFQSPQGDRTGLNFS